VSPAKMAELIEMSFGCGLRWAYITMGAVPPWEGAILRGKGRPIAVSCAKTAALIEMPFGVWTWVSLRKHVR